MSQQQSNKPISIKIDYQPAQKRLFSYVKRGSGVYLEHIAPMCLEVGGQRSGKTMGKVKFGVDNYCLKFSHCDILILRRKFNELEAGPIQDFKTVYKEFLENGSCSYNESKHVAKFANGSRVVFGGCQNNKDKDIEQYLGQAYPFILVDECAQFSNDAWELLYARNTINAACQQDEHGNFPVPCIVGCTNPIGPFWEYYRTLFAKYAELGTFGVGKGEPYFKEEGQRRSKDGGWWVPTGENEWRCIYNPRQYAYNHSTMLDNLEYQKRDPNALARLKSLPKAKQDKLLYGYLDKTEGQYYDCFDAEHHVVHLRQDPEAIIWQDWQPVWGGQDWGVGHWNACYLFTKALVRKEVGSDYKLKTVCFKEIAPDATGLTNIQFADLINFAAYYPRLPEDHPQYHTVSGKRCTVSAIYFSHEKFNRVMEQHSPADSYSELLVARGLCAVTRSTTDRQGSCSFVYNEIKNGDLVILDTCQGIINALPSLQRKPTDLDDVLKTQTKGDDRFDAFRYGLYGQLHDAKKPSYEKDREYAAKMDPFARHFYLLKQAKLREKSDEIGEPDNVPSWSAQLEN